MKIIKFGGKSLANGQGIKSVIDIIKTKWSANEHFHVVVSARGNATNHLLKLADLAVNGQDYLNVLNEFKDYQLAYAEHKVLEINFKAIDNLLKGINLLKNYSQQTISDLLAQGELISAKTLHAQLKGIGINSHFIDSRKLLLTSENDGEVRVNLAISEQNVQHCFKEFNEKEVAIITGFIASDFHNKTTTLGRNGSNYSAALFADFLNAEKVENYTHVDGIFSANPDWVDQASIITRLNFQEANELANFGTSILHPKTILPLIKKKIPLEIRNTFKPNLSGTLISDQIESKGIKAISVQENVGIIEVSGNGFFGQSGIDARIFTALSKYDISVGLVSQGSSERGISLLINLDQIIKAKEALDKEFYYEINSKEVDPISFQKDVGLVSIVGHGIEYFHKPFQSLIKNRVKPLLINNTLNGNTVGVVVKKNQLKKTVNVIHSQIFGENKVINLAVIGKGTVGSVFLDQCIANAPALINRKHIDIRIFALASSKTLLLNAKGINQNWKDELKASKAIAHENHLDIISTFAQENHLENLILIDNTASSRFAKTYPNWVKNGFNLVSSNKIANTLSITDYKALRQFLTESRLKYLYETNVGAGLPLVDTIRLLHDSGENITKIRGVFSGSLSYIFNEFSERNDAFGIILNEAVDRGFTEPDPREDLCGNDVARKLLILARELDLENEFEDVNIQNLIPKELRSVSSTDFFKSLPVLDESFNGIKTNQNKSSVLRYIGELSGDLQQRKAKLNVSLVSVPKSSSLGQVKGSDSIVEIFTESYGNQPIVIQGAGAGAKVTARGVLGDVLRLSESL